VQATGAGGTMSQVRADRSGQHDPVLITEAAPRLDEEYNARRRKYAIMMGTRLVCLVLAASFYHIKILMVLFAMAAVALPWMAVIIANDRPARRALSINFFRGRRTGRKLERSDRPELPATAGETRVVDPDDPR